MLGYTYINVNLITYNMNVHTYITNLPIAM